MFIVLCGTAIVPSDGHCFGTIFSSSGFMHATLDLVHGLGFRIWGVGLRVSLGVARAKLGRQKPMRFAYSLHCSSCF